MWFLSRLHHPVLKVVGKPSTKVVLSARSKLTSFVSDGGKSWVNISQALELELANVSMENVFWEIS